MSLDPNARAQVRRQSKRQEYYCDAAACSAAPETAGRAPQGSCCCHMLEAVPAAHLACAATRAHRQHLHPSMPAPRSETARLSSRPHHSSPRTTQPQVQPNAVHSHTQGLLATLTRTAARSPPQPAPQYTVVPPRPAASGRRRLTARQTAPRSSSPRACRRWTRRSTGAARPT